ncbi:uncharacterized protein LOC141848870 [Brevipalpus obovatus]|uniref:uncharacterized protein LOC141848870 n=1 Tax=Brevipalpus obovatus TaxID=246614 RepID=UPI003D9FA1A5
MSSASVYCLFQASPYEHLTISDSHPAHDDDRNLESDFKSNDCSSDRRVRDQSDQAVYSSSDTRVVCTMGSEKSTDDGDVDGDKCVSRKKYSNSQRNDTERCQDQRPILTSKSDHNSLSKDIPFKHHLMSSDKHFLNMIKSRPKRPKVKPPRKVATHGSCSDDDKMNASQSCTNDCDDDKAASESVRKSTPKSMTVQRGQENTDNNNNVNAGIDCFFQSPSKLLGRKKFGENANASAYIARGSLRNDPPIPSEKSDLSDRVKSGESFSTGSGPNLSTKNVAYPKPSGKIGIDIDPSKLLPGSDPRISIHMIKELKNRQKTSSTGPNNNNRGVVGSSITAASQVQTSILNEMRERKNLLRAKGTSSSSSSNDQEQVSFSKPMVCGKKSAQDGETRDSQPVSPSSERIAASAKVAIDASVKARASAFGSSMLKPTGTRASLMAGSKDGGDLESCDATIDSGSKRTSMTSLKGHQMSKVTDCSRDGSKIMCESNGRDKNVPSNDTKKRPSGDESHDGKIFENDGGKSGFMGKEDGDKKL